MLATYGLRSWGPFDKILDPHLDYFYRGEVGNTKGLPPPFPLDNTSLLPLDNTSPPGTRSQHLPSPLWTTPPSPPPRWDQITAPAPQTTPPFPLPGTRSQHLPPLSGQHLSSLPPDHVTTPPSPPRTLRRRMVRILLECILVKKCCR